MIRSISLRDITRSSTSYLSPEGTIYCQKCGAVVRESESRKVRRDEETALKVCLRCYEKVVG
jgi:hypothetical protein